jgi:hypothetical protein
MDAQLIIVMQNGFAEARDPRLRNRFEVVNVEKSADIKSQIWKHLLRVRRNGSVLVKWNGKMYQCEMKQDNRTYNRMEIEYHPHQDKFTI